MGLYVRQNDNRTKLQEQISSDLAEKARKAAQIGDRPDGVEDTAYIKDSKATTSLAFVWLLVALAAVGAFIWIIATVNNTQG